MYGTKEFWFLYWNRNNLICGLIFFPYHKWSSVFWDPITCMLFTFWKMCIVSKTRITDDVMINSSVILSSGGKRRNTTTKNWKQFLDKRFELSSNICTFVVLLFYFVLVFCFVFICWRQYYMYYLLCHVILEMFFKNYFSGF